MARKQAKSALPRSKNRNGILQVDVQPRDRQLRALWVRFLRWLATLWPENRTAAAAARTLVDSALDAPAERLREFGVKNAHLEAQIEKHRAETAYRRALDAAEVEVKQATAAKLWSEAELNNAAAAEKRLATLRNLQAMGIDIQPLVQDGVVTGLFVSRPSIPRLEAIADDRGHEE